MWMRDDYDWGPASDTPRGDGVRNLMAAAGVIAFLILLYNLM